MADYVPSQDEFDAWRENPVTQFVVTGLTRYADAQKQVWADKMWAGPFDPLDLRTAQARAEAYSDLAGLNYADALGINDAEIPNGT